jgi:hypothetical protein
MGRGNPKGMHGPMLDVLIETLKLKPSIDTTVWQSLALANAMTAMATNRRYAWQSVGALGAIELTAPGRSAATAQALRRLGFSAEDRRYFDLHAVLDVKHSEPGTRKPCARSWKRIRAARPRSPKAHSCASSAGNAASGATASICGNGCGLRLRPRATDPGSPSGPAAT